MARKRKKRRPSGGGRYRGLYRKPSNRCCPDCGKPMWSPQWGQQGGDPLRQATVDHIIPWALGGRGPGNYRLCCAECNQRKADRIIPELIAAHQVDLDR